jgi:hypothetical protein
MRSVIHGIHAVEAAIATNAVGLFISLPAFLADPLRSCVVVNK